MRRWTVEELRRVARDLVPTDPTSCAHAVRELGPLSSCLIAPVLEQAARHPSKPPWAWPAQCVADDEARILVAWQGELEPPLRRAFVLPLRWEREPDDPELPSELLRLAAEIRKAVGIRGLGLRRSRAFEANGVSLAGLRLQPDSAWPSLCAQLLLRDKGLRSRREVTATATYDPREGPRPVERASLEAKVEAAADAGIQWLFVAPADRARAESAAKGRLKIGDLNMTRDPAEMLEPMLAVLEAPPGRSRPLEERIDYYRRLRRFDSEGAQAYYADCLLEDLARQCADSHRGEFDELRGGVLVSVLSTNPENLLFSVEVLEPRRLIALHSDASGPDDPKVRRVLQLLERRQETEVECRSFGKMDDGAYLARVRELVEEAVKDARKPVVVDVTPGPKPISIVVTRALNHADGIVYLQTKADGRYPGPGTERLLRLDVLV